MRTAYAEKEELISSLSLEHIPRTRRHALPARARASLLGRLRRFRGDQANRPARTVLWDVFQRKRQLFLLIFLLSILLSGCSLFKIRPSIDDSLLDFYKDEPLAYTQASLRVTEKARENIQQKHYEEAIEQLNKALSIDPHNPFAYYFLGFSYTEKKEYKKSNQFLEKSTQLFSSAHIDGKFWKAKSYELLSSNWQYLGDEQKAKTFQKKAKAIYPNL